MIGCRPLSQDEITSMLAHLSLRDKTFFILGLKTGFRVSELLSIRVRDVYQHSMPLDRVSVARKSMKGKQSGRTVVLHKEAKDAITTLIREHGLTDNDYLFQSKQGWNRPISRVQAYRILRAAADACKLTGKIGVHSLRKSFASRMYDALDGDLARLQRAMGHKSVDSTIKYLSFKEEEIERAILGD